MSSRYGGRGYGRYGDSENDRTDERERFYERDAERGYGLQRGRDERGAEYGGLRRGGYAEGRGSYEREYGRERDYDSRDYSSRYGSRQSRESFERGGYASPVRRHESDEYGRTQVPRPFARDYERRVEERRVERAYRPDDDANEVRDYDTDYGRTTSRFYGRSGYEYGRDDYEDDERGRERHALARGREDDREGGSWLDRAADQVRSWLGGGDDERERGRYRDESRHAYGRGDGKFRGLGPKNYRRSDERLREEVCDRLSDNEWLDASEVEVNVVAGEVILTGAVDSRYARRLAENIADSVSGVENVQNNLRVQVYEAPQDTPLAGLDTPLPTPSTTTPVSDIKVGTNDTNDVNDVNDIGRPSSKAAGQS